MDPKIQIEYISSPRYKILVNDFDKSNAQRLIKEALLTIQDNCKKFGVKFVNQSEICVQREKVYTY